MATILNKKVTKQAEAYLSRVDPVVHSLIKAHGPCSLPEREYRPFDTLVVSIISQQLSAKAADTIEGRISKIVRKPFTPAAFLQIHDASLREAGLSRAKIRYIRELALRVAGRHLVFDELISCDNEAVIDKLVEVPGIGRWTAEMFLIFGLKRPDVLAFSDAGLQRAAVILYGTTKRKAPLLETVSEAWRPYRSVASWYLWQHLDNSPQEHNVCIRS